MLTDAAASRWRSILAEHDIVVNCILQDTDGAARCSSTTRTWPRSGPGALIVDVSCDEGMGFEWARPTSFAEPMFAVGEDVHYYAVDHSPSYLWNSATWENSEALLPYLRDRPRRARGVGRRRDHPPRDRDPRRHGPEPEDPELPGPRGDLPLRGQRVLRLGRRASGGMTRRQGGPRRCSRDRSS